MERFPTYFEDYQVGEKGSTAGRTISEFDTTFFSAISADWSPAHMDAEVMKKSDDVMSKGGKDGRITHGWFTSSLVAGLFSYYAPYIVGRDNPGAFLAGIQSKYAKPVMLGDTMKLYWTVEEKATDPDHPGFGRIKTAYRLVNQKGEAACEGDIAVEVRMKNAPDAMPTFKPGVPHKFKPFIPDYDKVYVLEDFPEDTGFETYGRTITETDVVNYSTAHQDYNRLYVDPVYAKDTIFKGKIVPVMLVAVLTTGLYFRDGPMFQLKKLASAGGHLSEKVTFVAPAHIGDTLTCRYWFESHRVSQSKPDRGIHTSRCQAVNQKNEVVVDITAQHMYATKARLAELKPPYPIGWKLTEIEGRKRG